MGSFMSLSHIGRRKVVIIILIIQFLKLKSVFRIKLMEIKCKRTHFGFTDLKHLRVFSWEVKENR